MARVGRDGQHRLLLAVEREGVGAARLVPERRVEPLEQRRRLVAKRVGARGLAQGGVDLRHPAPGIVDVALQLAQRLGAAHQAAVGIHHRLAAVLPGHVLVAGGRASLVLLEPVPVEVAGPVDPLQARLRRLQVPVEQVALAGRAPGGVQGDQPQRRGVGGAVVRRVRDQLEVRQFAAAKLVHDLAGLGVAVVVPLARLQAAQDLERAARERRIHRDGLQRHDEAVPPERRHEPGQAGRGHELRGVVAADRQTKRRHVVNRLVEEPVVFLVRRGDLEHPPLPVAQGLGVAALRVVRHAALRRRDVRPAVAQVVFQAAMP